MTFFNHADAGVILRDVTAKLTEPEQRADHEPEVISSSWSRIHIEQELVDGVGGHIRQRARESLGHAVQPQPEVFEVEKRPPLLALNSEQFFDNFRNRLSFEGWADYRDQHVLDLLGSEGFCLACLPLIGPPPEAALDFTIFVSKLDGISNLVVAAPCWSLEKVQDMYENLPGRQFAHGKTAVVIDSFVPAAEHWFSLKTQITYVAGVAHEPPYHRAGDRNPWAHCATLALQGAGVESRLRVVHIAVGLSRDHVFLHFLTPHALVPRRVLL